MLDIRTIRDDPDRVRRAAAAKREQVDIDGLLALDASWREKTTEADGLAREMNAGQKKVGEALRSGGDAEALKAEMKTLRERARVLEVERDGLRARVDELLLCLPNIPAADVPEGESSEENVVVREWGKQPEFSFAPKPHWELGERLGILDLERAAKVAGSSFILLRGAGALLERALINFMLDLHTREHGYTEVFPPFLANREAMTGTGQLPKLEEDMYRVPSDDLFLIPTAEVPLTNLHAGETIDEKELPRRYCASTACFRREAGAYGKETRGMIRVHQFNKVEMVRLVRPEDSAAELDLLVADAEEVFKRLGLRYRVVLLSTGELSFAAAKCYDLEVWAPGVGRWLEASSCSNFTDFQARRCRIRCRAAKGKPRLLHTLNGSGVALPRTMAALLETFQTAAGEVVIPEPLRPYMHGLERIGPAE